jgi:hypothetical protein
MEEYNIDHYTDPVLGYRKTLKDKFKIGHLIYNLRKRRITTVDISILGEIFQDEDKEEKLRESNYIPMHLTHEWLVNVFGFELRYMATNGITIYTSLRNGLKVNGQRGQFFIGVTIREKINSNGWSGTHISKPSILFVNELMDYSFLLKRDMITFNEDDLDKINELIQID